MTGAYCRVKRDGNWQSLQVEELTDAERREIFAGSPADELLRWIDMLCHELQKPSVQYGNIQDALSFGKEL
jgi:hypothetical protein